MSALAPWQTALPIVRCFYCDAKADVNCDVRLGHQGKCGRPCCPAHSAEVMAGVHRCQGHHRVMGGETTMRSAAAIGAQPQGIA